MKWFLSYTVIHPQTHKQIPSEFYLYRLINLYNPLFGELHVRRLYGLELTRLYMSASFYSNNNTIQDSKITFSVKTW